MTSVLIADDQQLMRDGLRALLEDEPDIEVIAEASDGCEAVQRVLTHCPDIVLMDIRMPALNGIAATQELVRRGSRSRIIVLTTFDLDEYIFGALHAGASGFLLKDAPAGQLIAAVRTVASGDSLIAPAVTRRVIDAFLRSGQMEKRAGHDLSDLTPREVDVLRLVARGLSNSEIADALVISTATVKTHVSNLLAKLGLRDRVHAVIAAYESGVVARADRP